MINFFNHNEAVTDTFSSLPDGARISTLGVVDPEKNKDKMFFSLDNPTECSVLLCIQSRTIRRRWKVVCKN